MNTTSKAFLLLTILFAYSSAMAQELKVRAQDVVFLNDGRLMDVYVTDASAAEIGYVDPDDTTKTRQSIAVADVKSVVYQSGLLSVYTAEDGTPLETPKVYSPASGEMTKQKHFTYMLQDYRLSEEEYVEYVKRTCPAAYEQFSKGYRQYRTATFLIGFGVPSAFIGIVDLYFIEPRLGNTEADVPKILATDICGFTFVGAGVGMMLASIPLFAVGANKMNHSYEIYNNQCRQQTDISLSLKPTTNGIGLALQF